MAFTTAVGSLTDLQKIGAGELNTIAPYCVLSASTFEDQIKIGRFAKMASGSLDNMDGSASPVIAGVVLRPISNTYEDGAVIDTSIHNLAEFCRKGLVYVAAKAGESPTWGDPVFASNAGDANDGLATVTNTDVATGARYLETVDTNLWLVELDRVEDVTNLIADMGAVVTYENLNTNGDVGTSASQLVAGDTYTAGLATKIGAAGVTFENLDANSDVGTGASQVAVGNHVHTYAQSNTIADPGDAGAIAVTGSGSCALVTAGAETRTIAIPSYKGYTVNLYLDTDGGDCVITAASAINQAGNNTITLDDAGDWISLRAISVGGTLAWRVVANDGCTLSTV